MKTYKIVLFFAVVALMMTSCRKDDIELNDPNNSRVNSHVSQFEAVWHGLDNGYVFWDIDTVDWDAKYKIYKPRFAALDRMEKVPDSLFIELWKGVVGQLRDHHFYLEVVNYNSDHSMSSDAIGIWGWDPRFRIGGGSRNVKFRDGYRGTNTSAQYAALANHERLDSLFVNTNGCEMRAAKLKKSNGKRIAYFRLSGFHIEDVKNGDRTSPDYFPMTFFFGTDWMNKRYDDGTGKKWFLERSGKKILGIKRGWINDPDVEGIIIDLRGNGGGSADNLTLIGGSLLQHDELYGYSKTKEGLGRLDYSAWSPYHIRCYDVHMDEAKPIVVLADDNSASCSEITTQLIHSLPNGTFIGRRTHGATCPLMPGQFNKLLSGVFGNKESLAYYCYTSNFNLVKTDYESLEGVGVVPDYKVDYEGIDGKDEQLDAAIRFLETGSVK